MYTFQSIGLHFQYPDASFKHSEMRTTPPFSSANPTRLRETKYVHNVVQATYRSCNNSNGLQPNSNGGL